jgi:phage head maturation protease
MLDSFSIGFVANREKHHNGIRQLLEVALHEVSLVAVPAYAGARVAEVREHPRVDLSAYRIPELPVSLLDDVRALG